MNQVITYKNKGHPAKDYFLYLEDLYNAQPGDIIPDTVARM